jgi:hypothetical protein
MQWRIIEFKNSGVDEYKYLQYLIKEYVGISKIYLN